MCVNDLACTGATPLVFLDYLAVGRLDPDEAAVLVRSIADACAEVGCVLAGGETPRCPASTPPATSTWPASPAAWWSGPRCSARRTGAPDGDAIVGIPSSGFHSNGYSLVRALVADGALALDPELLLAPTRLYVREIAGLAGGRRRGPRGRAHHGRRARREPAAGAPGRPAGRAGHRVVGARAGLRRPARDRAGWTRTRPGAPSTSASACAWWWRPSGCPTCWRGCPTRGRVGHVTPGRPGVTRG